MAKTKKKNTHGLKQIPRQIPVIREEDTAQAQEVLAHHQDIAFELRKKFGRDQAQSALTEINNLPEAAQLAFLKALAQERERDAADIALALNELSSLENVRKEARRALIQMRQAGIYPQWKVPVYQTSPYQIGDNSKRPPMIDAYPDFDDDDNFDDDDSFNDEKEYAIDISDRSPSEVVEFFINFWADRQYRTTYSLLAEYGPLRADLSIDEWAARRTAWAEIAKPEESYIVYQQEHEPEASDFQRFNVSIPDSPTSYRIVEISWSIIMAGTSDSQNIPELPQTLLRDPITGRHWFWTRYLLQQQEDKTWHIVSMLDQGRQLLNTPVEELQQRVRGTKDFGVESNQYFDQNKLFYRDNLAEIAHSAVRNYAQIIPTVFGYAALITHSTQDRPFLEEAINFMLHSGMFKLAAACQALLIEQFDEDKALNLRLLGQMQVLCSDQSFGEMDDLWGDRYEELAKESLHKSLAIENSFEVHLLLAQLLVESLDIPLEDAEDQLMQAKALSRGPADDATIEIQLGKIDTEREEDEEALAHFQRAIELEPTSAPAWLNAAEAYMMLGNNAEAEQFYRRAIELQPHNQNLYVRLNVFYTRTGQLEQAIEVLQEGLNANPDSPQLPFHLISTYIDAKNFEQAQILIEEYAQKHPDTPLLEGIRSMLDMHQRLLAIESAPSPTPVSVPARPITPPTNRMENPKPKHKKKKR